MLDHSPPSPPLSRDRRYIYTTNSHELPHNDHIHNLVFAETEEYGAVFLGQPKASFSPVASSLGYDWSTYDLHPTPGTIRRMRESISGGLCRGSAETSLIRAKRIEMEVTPGQYEVNHEAIL